MAGHHPWKEIKFKKQKPPNIFRRFILFRIPFTSFFITRGLFSQLNSGLWFFYRGDEVLWLWPWQRTIGKWISLYASGTGEFGDAAFSSLKDIDQFWDDYSKACIKLYQESVVKHE